MEKDSPPVQRALISLVKAYLHDMNNPFTGALGYAQVVTRDHPECPKELRYVHEDLKMLCHIFSEFAMSMDAASNTGHYFKPFEFDIYSAIDDAINVFQFEKDDGMIRVYGHRHCTDRKSHIFHKASYIEGQKRRSR